MYRGGFEVTKQFKDLRLWLVLIVFLGTVGVLFGGQKLAAKYQAENPTRRAIEAIDEVRDFKVKQLSDGLTVEINLDKVSNLESLLEGIKEKVEAHYNRPVRNFKITGRPDRKLRQIRYNISFYLEEALASGRYIQLKEALEDYQPVKARVYLGTDFIYLQLENDDHYLYEAIPRGSKIVSINNSQGGDSI